MSQTRILLVICPGAVFEGQIRSSEFIEVFKGQISKHLKMVDLDVIPAQHGIEAKANEVGIARMLQTAMSETEYAGILVSRIAATQEGPVADILKAIREGEHPVPVEQVYCTNPKLMDFMHMRELRELLKKIPDHAHVPGEFEHV